MLGVRGESQGDGTQARSSQSQASYLAVLSLLFVTYESRIVLLSHLLTAYLLHVQLNGRMQWTYFIKQKALSE